MENGTEIEVGKTSVRYVKEKEIPKINYESGKIAGMRYSKFYEKLFRLSIENEIIRCIISFCLNIWNRNNKSKLAEENIKIDIYKSEEAFAIAMRMTFLRISSVYKILELEANLIDNTIKVKYDDGWNYTSSEIEINSENLKIIESGIFPKINLLGL